MLFTFERDPDPALCASGLSKLLHNKRAKLEHCVLSPMMFGTLKTLNQAVESCTCGLFYLMLGIWETACRELMRSCHLRFVSVFLCVEARD